MAFVNDQYLLYLWFLLCKFIKDIGAVTLVNTQPNPDDTTANNNEDITNVASNGPATFTCTVEDSNPAARIEWYINDDQVATGTSGKVCETKVTIE